MKIKSVTATASLRNQLGTSYTVNAEGEDEEKALEQLKRKLRLVAAADVVKVKLSIELDEEELQAFEVDTKSLKVGGIPLVLQLFHPDKPYETISVRIERGSTKFLGTHPYWRKKRCDVNELRNHPDLLDFVENYQDKTGKGGYKLGSVYYTDA
jgi:hypothetical protein